MPTSTSDFRNPVCIEMKAIQREREREREKEREREREKEIIPTVAPPRANGDLGSVDSSDTYASCDTHPFLSQGDLLEVRLDSKCEVDSNLYVNPLDKGAALVKKSASGDCGQLRSLGASPMDEAFKDFATVDSASRISLNESNLPKHRKKRFQQLNRPQTTLAERDASQDSLDRRLGGRRTSFMPGRSIASVTRIINQHLFGLQSSPKGKNGSKSSLSIDSADGGSPQLESHRRSKSILKNKAEQAAHRHCGVGGPGGVDPESERLLAADTHSSATIVGSSEAAERFLSASPKPLPRQRVFLQQRSNPGLLDDRRLKEVTGSTLPGHDQSEESKLLRRTYSSGARDRPAPS
ncbi:uncharacterized protein LOC113366556 [Ctenocephalides felis]|uniref:uncharacterized protein LOC113366556 n=1 Tax=Ctenocephalides felis TaxID=7515 RepID=UPI000E6E251F|nr:uncharacterized protein LOC113366556 [Ctenocephalides felis]